METSKSERIVKRIEHQLRKTSRQITQFGTEEEALLYLSNSFRSELSADFVGIVLKEGENFHLKVWSGETIHMKNAFPIAFEQCSPNLISKVITFERADESCKLMKMLIHEKIPTWFTFPLRNELNYLGFCIVGYFKEIELIPEVGKLLDEFGKDLMIAMLYQSERNHKQKLHLLLNFQQSLIKETVEGDGLDGITDIVFHVLEKSVIIFDRFMRTISYKLVKQDENQLDELTNIAIHEINQKQNGQLQRMPIETIRRNITVLPIEGGGDLLGYIAVDVTNEKMDDYIRLSIDVARNIYSIQFIKQKLVIDTKEQVKDSFINKLLVEKIIDKEKIIQYANVFNWDIYQPHCVAIVYLVRENGRQRMNILEIEAEKSALWESLKAKISLEYPNILLTNKEGEYILIAPIEEMNQKVYWSKIYENIKKWVEVENNKYEVLLAVGGKTTKLSDYYDSYLQAMKTLNVVIHRYKDIGFALFDELGAYILLHHLKDKQLATIFVQKHLEPLLQYSKGKTMDLLHTLQVYLYHNGNLKETSDELYIHRSTLQYRLEKIESLLGVDLNYSEHRFNLMMALKLFDLFDEKSMLLS